MAMGSCEEYVESTNSEPCASTLLSFFDRLKSDDDRWFI
jgi:hypothetical protein